MVWMLSGRGLLEESCLVVLTHKIAELRLVLFAHERGKIAAIPNYLFTRMTIPILIGYTRL